MKTESQDRPTLCILIVNWNRKSELADLLADLHSQTIEPDEFIIVDSGSDDGAPEMVAESYPHIHLIRLHKNMGLSFARNMGITAAKADLILFLDNDMRVLDKNFLKKMLKSVKDHSECGIITFALVHGIWENRDAYQGRKLLGLEELQELANSGLSPFLTKSSYCFSFAGGASVIWRSVFIDLGLLEDHYTYGSEEGEFAFRCHLGGIRLLKDTSFWAVHLRSPQMRSQKYVNLSYENTIIFHARYLPLIDLVMFLSIEIMKAAYFGISRKQNFSFFLFIRRIIGQWRNQVIKKRNPVPNARMQELYCLLLRQPDNDTKTERNKLSAWNYYYLQLKYYFQRLRGKSFEEEQIYVVLQT